MFKRLVSLFLCFVTLFICVNCSFMSVSAASYDIKKLTALAEKYPDGKYWNHIGSAVNNPDGYTSVPCTHHSNGCSYGRPAACECNYYNGAIQCMGYSYKLAEEITGKNPREWKKITTLNVSNLKVGDVIRYINNTHSIVVVGVKGDTIAYTGANWGANCLIKWDTMKKSEITGFSYVLHDSSNTKTNTNLTFFENVKAPDSENLNSGEVWKMNNEGSLNVRENHSTSAKKVGSIAAEGTFHVYEKYSDGQYLWGRVDDGIVKGWAVLNYSTYVSGVSEVLTLGKVSNTYVNNDITLKWNKISGAEKYSVTVYKADGSLTKNLSSKTNSITFSLDESGIFYAIVSCSHSKAASWKMQSQRLQIKILPKSADEVQSIKIPTSLSLNTSKFKKLDSTVIPEGSKDAVMWKSSDENVAVVLQDGTVLAQRSGVATISCYSLTDSKIKDECTVTVTPEGVTGFRQNIEKTSAKKISLMWNEVQNASGYEVYRVLPNGKYELVCDTAELFCEDKGLSDARIYFYNIRAYETVDNKKNYSAFFGETAASTNPLKVKKLRVSDVTENSFRLSWAEAKGADCYVVFVYDTKKKEYKAYKSTEENSLVIEKSPGFNAKYRVSAVIRMGSKRLYGVKSDYIYGATKPEKAVLTAKAGEGTVTLSFKKVKGATQYQIYMKTKNGFKQVAVTDSKTLSVTLDNLIRNKYYAFKVRAYTKPGNMTVYSSYSKVVRVKTL